jgi:hypothetical protein
MLFLLTSCGTAPVAPQPAAPTTPPASAEPPAQSACTLETALVPGVPGSPGHLIASDINPNGASELAALMRVMQHDLATARDAILSGASVPSMSAAHAKMRCAWPTDPSDRNASFDALAQVYVGAVQALETAPPEAQRAAHDRVLDTCVACHQTTCLGPIPAIQALRFPRP